MGEASRLDAEIASLLESDGTYARLLTIPGTARGRRRS